MTDTTIIVLIGVIGGLIAIMTPVIKLNTSITKLNCSIDELRAMFNKSDDRLKAHGIKLDEHDGRLTVLETKAQINK